MYELSKPFSDDGSYIRYVLITVMECSYIRKKINGIEYKDSVNRARVLITDIYCTNLF